MILNGTILPLPASLLFGITIVGIIASTTYALFSFVNHRTPKFFTCLCVSFSFLLLSLLSSVIYSGLNATPWHVAKVSKHLTEDEKQWLKHDINFVSKNYSLKRLEMFVDAVKADRYEKEVWTAQQKKLIDAIETRPAS